MQNFFRILFDISIKVGNSEDVLKGAIKNIKEDLRVQSGATKSKILIACDEVRTSNDEKLVVQILCALIDNEVY